MQESSLLSYLRRLRNHEFAEAYELICSNLVVNELTAEDIKQAVDGVQGYASEMKFLKNMKRKHHLTEQIDEMKHRRHQALLSLRGRVAYFIKSPVAAQSASARRLSFWLSNYHEFFKHPSIDAQSRLVANLSSEMNESAEIQTALVWYWNFCSCS